jgi:hypothetical protein
MTLASAIDHPVPNGRDGVSVALASGISVALSRRTSPARAWQELKNSQLGIALAGQWWPLLGRRLVTQ